jgi:hypothetical protein
MDGVEREEIGETKMSGLPDKPLIFVNQSMRRIVRHAPL